MELNFDWRGFQSTFYPRRRPQVAASAEATSPVYLVVEGDTIISAFGENEDFSEWQGAPCKEMAAEVQHRDLVIYERKDVDRWIQESLSQPHFYEQVHFLRATSNPKVMSKSSVIKSKPQLLVQQNFFLEALLGWWAKILPSSYGVFIRLEGESDTQDFFVLIRRGRIECFHEPDLSSMGPERRKQPDSVVKYLSEKHLVRVQGLFVPRDEWLEWNDCGNPWRKMALAIRANRARLVPFRWGLMMLITSRAFL